MAAAMARIRERRLGVCDCKVWTAIDPELLRDGRADGVRYLVCPICVEAKQIDKGELLPNADVGGTVVMWQWIGDEGATTFSY
jgi:hypothetical protein